jgi:hypothetical protein
MTFIGFVTVALFTGPPYRILRAALCGVNFLRYLATADLESAEAAPPQKHIQRDFLLLGVYF